MKFSVLLLIEVHELDYTKLLEIYLPGLHKEKISRDKHTRIIGQLLTHQTQCASQKFVHYQH